MSNYDPEMRESITKQIMETVNPTNLPGPCEDSGTLRQFATGATRDSEDGKFDYEGFFSPMVFEAYGEYMHQHRTQADGNLRDSDNWQKGMGLPVYIKSMFRHFVDLWHIHRGHKRYDKKDGHRIFAKEACCAIMFNVVGYMHETIEEEDDA